MTPKELLKVLRHSRDTFIWGINTMGELRGILRTRACHAYGVPLEDDIQFCPLTAAATLQDDANPILTPADWDLARTRLEMTWDEGAYVMECADEEGPMDADSCAYRQALLDACGVHHEE